MLFKTNRTKAWRLFLAIDPKERDPNRRPAPRYIGACSRHGETERYLRSGNCVRCNRESNEALRHGTPRPAPVFERRMGVCPKHGVTRHHTYSGRCARCYAKDVFKPEDLL